MSGDLKECPWFSVEVGLELAPWLMSEGGNPKRVIAALELLATVVAVKLWAGRVEGNLNEDEGLLGQQGQHLRPTQGSVDQIPFDHPADGVGRRAQIKGPEYGP